MQEKLQDIFKNHHEEFTEEKIASFTIKFLQNEFENKTIRDFYVSCDFPYDKLIVGLLYPNKKKFKQIVISDNLSYKGKKF